MLVNLTQFQRKITMDTVCRLCAKEKPSKQLVNSIEDEKLDIPQKLIDSCRWNSIVTTEYATLPKKICKVCYGKLQLCWSFAENVARAQDQIFSMFPQERPLLTSTEHDINDTVANHEPNAADTSDELDEPVEPVEKVDIKKASPNIEHEPTLSGRRTCKIRPAPERYQAGSSKEKEKTKPKPLRNHNKAKSSNANGTNQSKPMQKENQLK